MRRFILLVMVIAAAAFFVPSASAGGKATLTPSPTSPTVGSTFTLSGCGYPRGKLISVGAGPSGASFAFYDVRPDANGCISVTFSAWMAGEWYAGAWYTSAPYRTLVDWFEFDVA